jgi:hypothetical protein
MTMRTKSSVRIVCTLVLVFLLMGFLPTAVHRPASAQSEPPVSDTEKLIAVLGQDIGDGIDIQTASSVAPYEFTLLRQHIALWADGKADFLIEQHINNITTEPITHVTWYFGWSPDKCTNIRALDSKGPLKVEKTSGTDYITVKVILRTPLQPGNTYSFKQFITIEGMASGYGNNWNAGWYVQVGNNIKTFEHIIAFPANSSITSVSPAPTEKNGHIVLWRVKDQPGYTLTINVPYIITTMNPVPLLLQTTKPWADQTYAYNTSPEHNIARWGCLTTSGAMIINYLATTQRRAFRTDPGTLDTWLKTNDGYTQNNGVKHAWLGKYARLQNHNVSMYWAQSGGYNPVLLDYYLKSGYPAILGVDAKWDSVSEKWYPGHYVVATGKILQDGIYTYSINDPTYGATTLKTKWSNTALTMILFGASEANHQLLNFAAQSPIHFMVTDPEGRKAGYNPLTDTTETEIPGAYYMVEGLAPLDGLSEPIVMKTMSIPDPIDGEYKVTLYGIGTGKYTMEVTSMDWQSTSVKNAFYGSTTAGKVEEIKVHYSQVITQIYLPLLNRAKTK